MPITERVELHDGAIRLAAQVSRPNTPGVHAAVIIAPSGTHQGEVLAYDWIASRLEDAGYVTLTITYRAKQAVDDPQDVVRARLAGAATRCRRSALRRLWTFPGWPDRLANGGT
jgi:hypothetical protein